MPPAADAGELAREASRAERVYEAQRTRHDITRHEQELAAARGVENPDAKKMADLEKALAEARKQHDAAQAALGQPSEQYTRFGPVYPTTSTGRRGPGEMDRFVKQSADGRVAINQMWMRHFGSPLVPTVFDFGLNGKRPTHPALLDWLAVELVDHGWRMKPIHRLIVTSTAYRMASTPSAAEANRQRDPENLYFWRQNVRRMEAEIVRDSTLAVADALDPTMFGPDWIRTRA